MHIGLVSLLKRGMSSPLLKQFWCPSLLCQCREHGMAKHMRSNRNASPRPEPPKKGINICIGQRLARSCSMPFEEQMISLYLSGVCTPNIGHDFINEVC